ncbi:hypothetical protein HK44_000390 [Pseudomonas fluorescens HK44]|uniref:Na+/H+ antiporter NhaC-like C-terminal domain-containing protein n=1 Tax=Pseudomonas fluorescens HK44 TaxID=1042209 RepID=A0A010S1A6_PSEFL|nr:hypothetical protein HK44_000390 [Pseudomonas fluorescens HK44]
MINAVIAAVGVMLVLSLSRVHVVITLIVGSAVSDSTLGPTSGLNIDGQHHHIRDTVVPTFLHYNLPLLAFGWVVAMVL